MGARFEQALSSLGNIEERLRRSLNLVGLVQAGFNPDAVPVVIVDDATRPGCAVSFRGRSFSAFRNAVVPAAGTGPIVVGLRAQNEIIIDALLFSVEETVLPLTIPGVTCQLFTAGAAVADPFAIATVSAGSFIEAPKGSDRPPFLTGGGAVTTGMTQVNAFILETNKSFILPTRLFLEVGSKIAIRFEEIGVAAIVTASVNVTFIGRVF